VCCIPCVFYTKPVFAQPPTSAVSTTLPAFAADRRAAAAAARWRPISCQRGAQQQTRCTQLLSIDGTDRQTDGRTPDRYIDAYRDAAYCNRRLRELTGRLMELTDGLANAQSIPDTLLVLENQLAAGRQQSYRSAASPCRDPDTEMTSSAASGSRDAPPHDCLAQLRQLRQQL